MHSLFVQDTSAEIAYSLSIIFRKSLESKSVPVEWEKGRITAFFKKESKKLASNYRPVSLTLVVCTCLAKLVREHIIGYMKENNFLARSVLVLLLAAQQQ